MSYYLPYLPRVIDGETAAPGQSRKKHERLIVVVVVAIAAIAAAYVAAVAAVVWFAR